MLLLHRQPSFLQGRLTRSVVNAEIFANSKSWLQTLTSIEKYTSKGNQCHFCETSISTRFVQRYLPLYQLNLINPFQFVHKRFLPMKFKEINFYTTTAMLTGLGDYKRDPRIRCLRNTKPHKTIFCWIIRYRFNIFRAIGFVISVIVAIANFPFCQWFLNGIKGLQEKLDSPTLILEMKG